MIKLNKRQYEILTFMANTDCHLANDDVDIWALLEAGLCIEPYEDRIHIAPHAREMFRDAGLRRVQ
jgi:hypothetical protein